MRFVFVEERKNRVERLKEVIGSFDVSDRFQIEVIGDETFETGFRTVLDSYKGRRLPPTFAFIDPFGWSGVPFSMVGEIMSHPSCEVLVNFMYEGINRFLRFPDQEPSFDAFFGTQEWREGNALADPRDRNRFLHNLYYQQLRRVAGAKFVRSFEMRNERDGVDYYLFYATNNILGLKKMKAAMWKVDESGEFTFSDATDPNQAVLFGKEPRLDLLEQQLLAQFRGRDASVGEVEQYVLEETAFREAHYRRVLKPLELADSPTIEVVNPPPQRKRGTYPERFKSMRLRFRSDSS